MYLSLRDANTDMTHEQQHLYAETQVFLRQLSL